MLSVSPEAWSFKYSQVENKLSNIQDQTKNTWGKLCGWNAFSLSWGPLPSSLSVYHDRQHITVSNPRWYTLYTIHVYTDCNMRHILFTVNYMCRHTFLGQYLFTDEFQFITHPYKFGIYTYLHYVHYHKGYRITPSVRKITSPWLKPGIFSWNIGKVIFWTQVGNR